MEGLPDDVEAKLLRGLAAYLKATPANELPSSLRRFQNFRIQALISHRRKILDALDDDGFRSHVGQWLDDRPSLPKADVAALRAAVERKEGWHEELAAAAAVPSPPSDPGTARTEAAEREREKLRRARDEARRKLDETQREAQALRTRVAELELALKGSERARAALEKELSASRRAVDKATTDLEREQRKARAGLDKGQAAADRAKAEVKELRRELQALRRHVEKAEKPRPKGTARKKTPARAKGPRRALPVPKGRFEDDPATLEAWLAAEGVHLLVDGYNASMSREGFGHLDLAAQRERLVEAVTKLARRTGVRATVVFDGSDVSGVIRQPRGPAKVQYSAADEIADDHLIGLLESLPPDPVIVATSDRELQERSASLGATVATSEQLLSLLR